MSTPNPNPNTTNPNAPKNPQPGEPGHDPNRVPGQTDDDDDEAGPNETPRQR